MKTILLQELDINYFMGIRSLQFSPMGKNAILRGDNGTFKTTNASGFSWLLFDKDVHGNSTSNFSIKTTDENEKVIPNIDHSVTGILDIDGIPLTLQKIYREKWLKKRKVLTSHTTEYLIDEVPVKKKEYDAKIAEIIPEETFRLLTDINYFNSDKFGWQNRRKILFQLCEGLSEEALNAAEKAKKILASKKKKINEKKDGIQPRIDEKNRDLAAIADYNKAEIQARITDLDKQIQDIKTDSTRATLLKERAELEAKLGQIKTDQAKKKQEATSQIRANIEDVEDDYAKTRHIINDIEYEIKNQDKIIADTEIEIQLLYISWDKITREEPDILDLCPTCQKPFLPEEKEAVRAEFNLQQSKIKEEINRAGKIARGKKEGATAKKIELEVDLKQEQIDIAKIEKNLDKKKAELAEIQQTQTICLPEQAKEMAARITDIKDLLDQQDQQHDTETLEADLATERAKMAKIDAGEEHKIRIIELEEQERSLSAEIERLEADLFQAEENIQEQARLLEVPINAKFGLVKFKLFKPLINGGVEPCCETMVGGNPYGHGLNKGGEINADLDTIKTLSNHYQIQCPLFIDDCSLISKPIDPGCQHFKLINVKDMEKLEITYE